MSGSDANPGGIEPSADSRAASRAREAIAKANKVWQNTTQAPGANLPDAAGPTHINITGGTWRIVPLLGQASVLQLDATSAQEGDQITVTRTDANAFTYTVNNNAGVALVVMPASKVNFAKFQFTGGDWVLKELGTQ